MRPALGRSPSGMRTNSIPAARACVEVGAVLGVLDGEKWKRGAQRQHGEL
jgi:hypothetical protein